MQTRTRRLFNSYIENVSRANGQPLVKNEPINYQPSRQQALYAALGDRADFLKNINHVTVDAQVGERLGLGTNRPVAGRTNTDDDERKTKYIGELNPDEYHCKQTNFDTHIRYPTLDSWSHIGEFNILYMNQVVKQIARDLLMIGWNGEEAVANTDLIEYPMLQDVNIGWLEKVRRNAPKRFMGYDSEGMSTEDTYTVGEGGNYGSLDALVFDMTINLLDEWHQSVDDLVVIVGRELWVSHGLTLLSNSTMPTERNALNTWFAAQTVAGMPCMMVPYFPVRGLVVTSYDNLSIYHQSESLRRTILDNPKRDRVEEYCSENQAFVVEDYGKFAGVRDGALLLPDSQGGWQ